MATDPPTRLDGVFIPSGTNRLAKSVAAAMAIFVFVMALAGLSSENSTWTPAICNYTGCRISTDDLSDYVDIDLTLSYLNVHTVVRVQALAMKAPYICKIKAGACFVSAGTKLALEKTYLHSTGFILGSALAWGLFTAAVLYPTSYVILHGLILLKAIERASRIAPA